MNPVRLARLSLWLAPMTLMLLPALPVRSSPVVPSTILVSKATNGEPGNDESMSFAHSIDAHGRLVVFQSYAVNLVPGDSNGSVDIFVRDLALNKTSMASVATDNTPSDGDTNWPSISSNGNFVAFDSGARYLTVEDSSYGQVVVRNLKDKTTNLASVATDGTVGNVSSGHSSLCFSADGRYLVFESCSYNHVSGDTNETWDVFVRDLVQKTTKLVSVAPDGLTPGNDESGCAQSGYYGVAISGDGRYVAFGSLASNLVPDDTNEDWDVFVRDLQNGTTRLVSVSSGGTQGNKESGYYGVAISLDGRYVAFESYATNLVPGDVNTEGDIFVRDLVAGRTSRVSVAPGGTSANGGSWSPSISADGRYVAFASHASNLVRGDANYYCDIFVRDLVAGKTIRASVANDYTEGDYYSYYPSISGDGRYVAFSSLAANLVSNDTNDAFDVFVRGPLDIEFLTMADLSHLLRCAAGLAPSTVELVARADIIPDGRVKLDDVMVLLRHIIDL